MSATASTVRCGAETRTRTWWPRPPGLRPGSALDVGSGEGADAIWLARQGWRVTAVDISSVALARAAERASQDAEASGRITWAHHDLTASPPPAGTFDLVSAQFMHLPLAQRTELHHRLAASVAPGGTLLIVGHHPSDLEAGNPPPQRARACSSPRRKSPPGWIRTSGKSTSAKHAGAPPRTRTANAVTVTDSVLRAHRRPPRP